MSFLSNIGFYCLVFPKQLECAFCSCYCKCQTKIITQIYWKNHVREAIKYFSSKSSSVYHLYVFARKMMLVINFILLNTFSVKSMTYFRRKSGSSHCSPREHSTNISVQNYFKMVPYPGLYCSKIFMSWLWTVIILKLGIFRCSFFVWL